jgi:hypothetical protein
MMMWCWWCAWPGLRGSRSSGRWRGRAAAEARAHRRSGPGDLARENKIGWACELQWVTAVLLEYWIGGGRWRRGLSTGSQGYGGAPARWGARESERQWKCTCVSARVSPWGAPGRTSSRETGTVGESCCWQAGGTRGGSGSGGATWSSEERASAGWGAAARVLGRHVA